MPVLECQYRSQKAFLDHYESLPSSRNGHQAIIVFFKSESKAIHEGRLFLPRKHYGLPRTRVEPYSSTAVKKASITLSACNGSSEAVGSSAKITTGLLTRARTMATRCRSPKDKVIRHCGKKMRHTRLFAKWLCICEGFVFGYSGKARRKRHIFDNIKEWQHNSPDCST